MRTDDGELIFVQPFEEQEPFDDFVNFVVNQEQSGKTVDEVNEVRYAQTRKLYSQHMSPFFFYIPKTPVR